LKPWSHEVAHEVMGHVGTRRKLSLSLTASFGALGIFAPGVGLLDFVVNPLVVRAFGRHQELQADQKAVEILRAMGHTAPRRALATALEAIAAHTPREREGLEGLLATHPTIDDRLAALIPLEPPAKPVTPVARAKPPR
jgi:Zn-dependent protease with chaperone function